MTDSELVDVVKDAKSWRVSVSMEGTFLIADEVRYLLTDDQAEMLWGLGRFL